MNDYNKTDRHYEQTCLHSNLNIVTRLLRRSAPRNDAKTAFTLAEVFSPHPAGSCRAAFTLSEVLITLGIIGIVAAMTLPSLIHKQKMKVLENQFKAAYSLVYQTITKMGTDDYDISSTYCDTTMTDRRTNIFIQDFAKHVDVIRSKYTDTGWLRDIGYKQNNFYQSGFPLAIFNPDSHNNGAIILKNGMMVASSGCWASIGNNRVDFVVDTNGTKGPNRFGYDVFYFQIGKNNNLYTSFISSYSEEQIKECCNLKNSGTCSMTVDSGATCSQFALQNVNPQDKTKTYWESLP